MKGNREVGTVIYSTFYLKGNSADFEIWMNSFSNCGRGYGSDALRTICLYLAREHGIKRFIIRPSKKNRYAVRFYERLGFKNTPAAGRKKVIADITLKNYVSRYGEGDYGREGDMIMIYDCSPGPDMLNS